MTEITPQPGIMDIALYQGGKSHIAGRTDVLKLSSNENPWGPSPAAMEAVRAATADLHRYPSTDHATLRAAIAEVRGLPADQIICGCGSDEVLSWLCYAYAGPGDEVLYTEHGFGLYRICALAAGATPVIAPETDRRVDVDHLLAAVTPRTRLIFIANPGNPTGTLLSEAELTRLADGVPPQVMLVLDGAYAEFAPGYDGGAALIAERDNLVMTRTFSKLYGLGGLRIGWGYGPRAVIDVLNRIRGPFNLSGLQLAAAEAAIRDRDFAERCVTETLRLRAALVAGLAELGIAADPSQANFVMARFASVSEADAAEAQLLAQGIIVRRPTNYGFPAALRITVPTEPDLHRFLTALAGFREAAA